MVSWHDEKHTVFLNSLSSPEDGPFMHCQVGAEYASDSHDLAIPGFIVHVDRKRNFTIEYTDAEDKGTTVGSSVVRMNYKYPMLERFVHDYTFEIFSLGTDRPLTDFYKRRNDRSDALTPDYIERIDGRLVVLEFSTSHTRDNRSLRKIAAIKEMRYKVALQERSDDMDHCTDFFYLIVSAMSVYTNMAGITQRMIDELVYRFKVATAINEHLKARMLVPINTNNEDSLGSRKVENIFNSIGLKYFPDTNVFTEEFYLNCSTPKDKTFLDDLILREFSDSMTEVSLMTKTLDGTMYTKDELRRRNLDRMNTDFKDFFNSVDENLEYHPPNKVNAILGIPFVLVENSERTSRAIVPLEKKLRNMNAFEGDNPYIRLWKGVFRSIDNKDVIFPDKNDSDMYEDSMYYDDNITSDGGDSHINDKRNKNFRVVIDTEVADSIEFAKVGVEGKLWSDNFDVKKYRDEKKRFYRLSTDTRDITDLLNNCNKYFYLSTLPLSLEEDVVIQNFHIANRLHGEVPDDHIKFLMLFRKSRIGRYCSFVSDIGFELSLSLRQNVRKKTMLVRKLRSCDVYLLIKPTNSASHVFFSLMMYNSDIVWKSESPVFKKLHTNGRISWTEFHSYNISKLNNLSKCDSLMFNCVSFAYEQFQEDALEHLAHYCKNENMMGFTGKVSTHASPIFKTSIFLMLVLLHDKHHVEEVITDFRYAFMESMVERPEQPNPTKMLSKLSTACRSRLHVYVTNQFIKATKRLTEHEGIRYARNEDREPVWIGLFDPWTELELTNPQQIVNILYYGYLKNKDEQSETNTRASLYKKILTYEDKMEDVNDRYLGFENPIRPKFHEFSPDLLKACCDVYREDLKTQVPGNLTQVLCSEICRSLSYLDLESLATLKASCGLNEAHYNKIPRDYHRPKVFQQVCKLLKLYDSKEVVVTSVIDLLEDCLRNIEDRGGYMHIDLFKKSQHGGEREIYVMGIEERICQLVLEQISRVLCRYSKSETMTNPRSKNTLFMSHNSQVRDVMHENHTTRYISADAMKWNQGHYVSKFAMMLIRLTPETFHGFIFRACALWEKKRIFLTRDIIELIRGNPLTTSNPYLNRIQLAYAGKAEEVWMKRDNTFIQTRSGMMQGILHYTSSLLHTIYLRFLSIQAKLLSTIGVTENRRQDIIITNMQSSDDSGMMISIKTDTNEEAYNASCFCASIFRLKANLGIHLGIYDSVKTTRNTKLVYEFNSEYFFRTYQFRPTFRWVAASCQMTEHENIAARQEEMSSLATTILEGGGSITLVSQCQLGQGILHYRMMGLHVHQCFYRFFMRASLMCEPALGFFLLDNPFGAGIAGFGYNVWIACKNSTLGLRYNLLFENLKLDKVLRSEEFKALTNTSTGIFVHSTSISFGRRKKWTKFVNDCGLPAEFAEFFDSNHMALFSKPKTLEELRFKMSLKIHNPGIVESLSKGNTTSRTCTASVYMLSDHVIIEKEQWNRAGMVEEFNSFKRTSMINSLEKSLKEVMESKAGNMTLETQKFLFPMLQDYKETERTYSSFINHRKILKVGEPKKLKSYVQVTDVDESFTSPLKICACIWLKVEWIPASANTIRELFDELKARIRFLRETIVETVEASPFEHAHQLYNYLSRLELKSRVVRLTGSPLLSRAGQTNLTSLIEHDFSVKYRITKFRDKKWEEDYERRLFEAKTEFQRLKAGRAKKRKQDKVEARIEEIKHKNMIREQFKGSKRKPMIKIDIDKISDEIETDDSGEEFDEEDFADERTFGRVNQFKLVTHSLAMLSALPITIDAKNQAILELIQKGEVQAPSMLAKSRRQAFHIMSKFAHNYYDGNRPQLFKDITSCRMGVIGGYTVNQEYVRGRYTNSGEWCGKIDDLNIKIKMKNREDGNITYLSSITVNQDNLIPYLPLIINLLNELRINNDIFDRLDDSESDPYQFLLNGSFNQAQGCPVYVDADMKYFYDIDRFDDFRLTVNRSGGLSLVGTQRRSIARRSWRSGGKMIETDVSYVDITLLRIAYKRSDIDFELPLDGLRELMPLQRCWIGYNSLDKKDYLALLVKASSEPGCEDYKFFDETYSKMFTEDRRKWAFLRVRDSVMKFSPHDLCLTDFLNDPDRYKPNEPANISEQVLNLTGDELMKKYAEVTKKKFYGLIMKDEDDDSYKSSNFYEAIRGKAFHFSDGEAVAFSNPFIDTLKDTVADAIEFYERDELADVLVHEVAVLDSNKSISRSIAYQHPIFNILVNDLKEAAQGFEPLILFFRDKIIDPTHLPLCNWLIDTFDLNENDYKRSEVVMPPDFRTLIRR